MSFRVRKWPGLASSRSRFEDEAAALITAATGLVVDVDMRVQLPAGRPARVDLYVSELRMYVELDPARWHSRAGSAERDAAKSRRLLEAGHDVIRLRTATLPALDVPFLPVRGQSPWKWVRALASTAKDRGANWRDLTSEEVADIVGRVAMAWNERGARPSPSALDAAPHLVDEFVENLTHRGVDLTWLAPGSQDRCRWKCRDCGHTWATAISNRTTGANGCRRCASYRNGRFHAQPKPGQSLAELYPRIAIEFLSNLEFPGYGPTEMTSRSGSRCRWECVDCGHTWEATPHARTRSTSNGCPNCYNLRRGHTLRVPKAGRSLAELFPQIAAQLVRVADDPAATALNLKPGSKRECYWRCERDHEWKATPNMRTTKGSGCPDCYREHSITLTAAFPHIAAEFVVNLTRPELGPDQLPSQVGDRCQWRCANGHEWEATVRGRTSTKGGTRCWPCRLQEAGSLANEHQEIAAEFVENLARPDVGPDLMRPKSNDRCRWRCACGHEWITAAHNRITSGPGCSQCRRRARTASQ